MDLKYDKITRAADSRASDSFSPDPEITIPGIVLTCIKTSTLPEKKMQ